MRKVIEGMKPTLTMVVAQTIFAGCIVLYKLATNDGMNLRILVAYRFLFAAAFTIPFALFVERKSRPKLTWTVFFQAFLCGLLGGSLAQNIFVESLVLTSSTFTTAMTNLTPAITFLMAISFRLEKRGWGTSAGKAKVMGTLVGIGGAMLLTFYKGPALGIWATHVDLLHKNHPLGGHANEVHQKSVNHVLGALLALGSCVCFASWFILQAKMAERYPCPCSITALMATMAAIQGVVFALCTERDWNQWKLGWNIRLLTVAYSGILVSGLMFSLVAWCIHMRGPLFVSIFNPLMLVLVAIAGSLLLDEKIHSGSVVGSVIIVMGLYVVLWGKRKEMKMNSQLIPDTITTSTTEMKPIDTVTISNKNSDYSLQTVDNEALNRDLSSSIEEDEDLEEE
ncbi:hypothetical protein LguiA_027140 [Lonicera macranthoides]